MYRRGRVGIRLQRSEVGGWVVGNEVREPTIRVLAFILRWESTAGFGADEMQNLTYFNWISLAAVLIIFC